MQDREWRLLVGAPIDRDELAHQLRKLREREALADEGRLAREAPLLLTLTGRLLDREGAAALVRRLHPDLSAEGGHPC